MRLLSVDYGEKQVGIAFSEGVLATGLMQITTKEALLRIQEICRQRVVEKIIIGKPGGRLEKIVTDFAAELQKQVSIPIILWDETLSSHYAQTALLSSGKSRKRRHLQEHMTAAAVLLQSYIEEGNV